MDQILDLTAFLQEMEKNDTFCVDFETLHSDEPDKVRVIGMGLGIPTRRGAKEKLWYISFDDEFYSPKTDWTRTLHLLDHILQDQNITQIAYNCKYEAGIWQRHGVRVRNKWADPMIATWLLDEYQKKLKLRDLVKKEFNYIIPTIQDTNLWQYYEPTLFGSSVGIDEKCRDDVRWAMRLWEKRRKQLDKVDLLRVFHRLEMFVPYPLAAIERTGMAFDIEAADAVRARLVTEMQELSEKIYVLAKQRFDLSSSDQVSDLLFKHLQLPHRPILDEMDYSSGTPQLKYKKKNGQVSVNKELLKYYMDFPIVRHILEYRAKSQLISMFLPKLIKFARDSHDGRIRSKMLQTGTVTGRLSSAKPNLQQNPKVKWFRDLYIEKLPYRMLFADYSQLELYLIAHVAKSLLGWSTFGDALDRGEDLHQNTADLMNKAFNSNMFERPDGKRTNFALSYGMTVKGFMLREGLKYEDAKQQHEAFHRARPEIQLLIGICAKKLSDFGFVETIFGLRRRFKKYKGVPPEDIGWDASVAFNAQIQGCIARDTLILTKGGYKKISTLDTTDTLLTQQGETRSFHVFDCGSKPCFDVFTTHGRIRCTKDHRFFIYANGTVQMRTLSSLNSGDIILGRKACTTVGISDSSLSRSEEAELLGMLIGDGTYSVKTKPGVRLCFGHDFEYLTHFKSLITTLYNYEFPARAVRRSSGSIGDSWYCDVYSRGIRDHLLDLGLDYVSGTEKRIPEWLYSAPFAHRCAFLRGLFDTDGCVTSSGVQYVSKVYELVFGCWRLLLSLGISSYIMDCKGHYRCNVRSESVLDFRELIGFACVAKAEKLNKFCLTHNLGCLSPIPRDLIRDVADLVRHSDYWRATEKVAVASDYVKSDAIIKRTNHIARKVHRIPARDYAHLHRMSVEGGTVGSCFKFLDRLKDSRDKARLSFLCGQTWVKIKRISPAGLCDTMDIEIFDSDHSYVGNGFVMHNSGGQIGKLALARTYDRFLDAGLDAEPIAQVHDELGFRIHKDHVERGSIIMKDTMENVVKVTYPLKVQVLVGSTWGEVH
jgi:DNA polymerase I-like protein with 3'-5' exonuclease and polymerase domains